ncbi:hypothetical protein D3C85_1466150 [compost metagenome]
MSPSPPNEPLWPAEPVRDDKAPPAEDAPPVNPARFATMLTTNGCANILYNWSATVVLNVVVSDFVKDFQPSLPLFNMSAKPIRNTSPYLSTLRSQSRAASSAIFFWASFTSFAFMAVTSRSRAEISSSISSISRSEPSKPANVALRSYRRAMLRRSSAALLSP